MDNEPPHGHGPLVRATLTVENHHQGSVEQPESQEHPPADLLDLASIVEKKHGGRSDERVEERKEKGHNQPTFFSGTQTVSERLFSATQQGTAQHPSPTRCDIDHGANS